MALISCFECKKEISDKAVTCPHCGVPIPIEKGKRSDFILFVSRFFGLTPAVCRKCRSPIKSTQHFCKTCGIYFPFHEFNKFFFLASLYLFIAWVLANAFPEIFGFLIS